MDFELLNSAMAPYLMKAIIDSADDAIISKNIDGIITSWNRGAERIFGYTAQETIGQSILLLIPPDRHGEETEIIGKIRTGQRVEHFETLRRRKNGTLVDISLTVSPIYGPEGTITGASKIARQITDLKQAQQQLQVSEERYRTLFSSMDEGFCVIEIIFDSNQYPIDWRFLEVNPAFEKHNGLVNAQGKTARELLPDLEEEWFQIYGQVALTGKPIRFQRSSEAMNRWFDLYAFSVGELGNHRVAVLFKDITERKRYEQEREELLLQIESERAKLDYLFTKAPAFVATLQGPEHVFELTNPAYLQLIGHRQVVGKPARQALPEVEGQGFFELLDSVFQTGEPFTGRELPIQIQREPEGQLEQRFLDFVYQPIFGSDGAVSGIFAHGVDITEQVRARKESEAANRAKDEFLATLSHELRTPLNAILGWASLLNDSQLQESDRVRAVDAIQRNSQLQAQLIEDILDVSRIISGKMRLEVRPIELSAVVNAALDSVHPAAQAKNIRLQRVSEVGSTLISGDANRLQQVVWNLLSNAIKFTPKGGQVQIRLERVDSHIEIAVVDTGIGIPPNVLPHVFERFRQADSTSTRQYGGLGLGLAIVRHVIEMHGGTVEAQSGGEGQGSIFKVMLPLISQPSLELLPEPNTQREAPSIKKELALDCPPELQGLHVLVVDDETDARVLAQTVLERCGARVSIASSVEEALHLFREEAPDVLVSDLGMPGEDGYSLIKKVRDFSDEEGGRIPAAALTAYARVEDRLHVLRSGFQIHVTKPIEPNELVMVVASLVGRHA